MTESLIQEPGAERLVPQDLGAGLSAPLLQQRSVAIESSHSKSPRRISLHAIRAVAQCIAEHFQPEKIILFGSYAYGHPKPESDVDLLVIMDTSLRSRQQRLEISRALSPRPFPLDVIVRTPQELAERIAMGDLFLREITTRGKVLYERSGESLLSCGPN
jgi:predicted nucleotidyltransferase